MFPYYGRKTKLGPLYPAPSHDTIVEPFAGSAAYSLLHADRDVMLFDKDAVIVAIWRHIIAASRAELMALPILAVGESLEVHRYLSDAERWLIGFYINQGSSVPKKTATKKTLWHERNREKVADTAERVRHWTITEGSYVDAPDVCATWFIDPPYQGNGGRHYRRSCSNAFIDYPALAQWALGRSGELIVCENSEATWLPFTPLAAHHSLNNVKTTECIFRRESEPFAELLAA